MLSRARGIVKRQGFIPMKFGFPAFRTWFQIGSGGIVCIDQQS
jgi:hypothetical protein